MLRVDCGTGHKEARKRIRATSWGNADREGKGPQNKEESMTFILVSSMLIIGMMIGRPSFLHDSSLPIDYSSDQMGAVIHDVQDPSVTDDAGRSAFDVSFATKEIGMYQDMNARYAVGEFPLGLEDHGELVVLQTIGSPEIHRIQPVRGAINPNK